jgi:hypothetical protein
MLRSKRLLAFILSVLLLCGNTVTAFADNLGNSYVPETPPPIIGGGGGNPTFATYKNWGFRITMAPADKCCKYAIKPERQFVLSGSFNDGK